jgi:hypothetical protein
MPWITLPWLGITTETPRKLRADRQHGWWLVNHWSLIQTRNPLSCIVEIYNRTRCVLTNTILEGKKNWWRVASAKEREVESWTCIAAVGSCWISWELTVRGQIRIAVTFCIWSDRMDPLRWGAVKPSCLPRFMNEEEGASSSPIPHFAPPPRAHCAHMRAHVRPALAPRKWRRPAALPKTNHASPARRSHSLAPGSPSPCFADKRSRVSVPKSHGQLRRGSLSPGRKDPNESWLKIFTQKKKIITEDELLSFVSQ